MNDDHSDDDDDAPKTKGKSRRELPSGAVQTLKAWLLSPEHFTHPYPTPQDQIMLMQKTGIDKKQLKNWFTNARRRIWKPMLKKQLEQGKLAATGAGGGGVAVPGVVPGLMVSNVDGTDNPHSVQAMQTHYQQAIQQHGQPQQPQQFDQYSSTTYVQPAAAPGAPANSYTQQFYQPAQQQQYVQSSAPMAQTSVIGSIPPLGASSAGQVAVQMHPSMNKTDSHAVLMELFARDQDLVRQASESQKMKKPGDEGTATANPIRAGSQSKLMTVPSMNSWPHFSSISSLNNLGTMTGVKSITSMSGADLASQGNLNRMGNLAQVKSMESMGKNDSYAFLEVFFGDRTMSSVNMAGKDQSRGVKREREEDNDVGLSLDADESPSIQAPVSKAPTEYARHPNAPTPAPLPANGKDPVGDSGTLKRAYDDALAARGLMSVSRSSERLSDLALPAKMRKTLSQEFLRQHQVQAQAVHQQQQQQQQPQVAQPYSQVNYAPAPAPVVAPVAAVAPQPTAVAAAPVVPPPSQQYPGQHPQQQQQQQAQQTMAAPSQPLQQANSSGEVHVPSASLCTRCNTTGVDTQLRPCGHMFHERCLKPSLQVPIGQPKCPICNIPIQSALLAVPTDENLQQQPQQQQQQWATTTTTTAPPAPTGFPAPQPAITAESSAPV